MIYAAYLWLGFLGDALLGHTDPICLLLTRMSRWLKTWAHPRAGCVCPAQSSVQILTSKTSAVVLLCWCCQLSLSPSALPTGYSPSQLPVFFQALKAFLKLLFSPVYVPLANLFLLWHRKFMAEDWGKGIQTSRVKWANTMDILGRTGWNELLSRLLRIVFFELSHVMEATAWALQLM